MDKLWKWLIEKVILIGKLELTLKTGHEYIEELLKEKDLEILLMNADTKSKRIDNDTESLKFKCELCEFQSNSKQGLKTHI